jgi:glucans biosynthesis protein
VRPARDARSITIHALLDSESATGAFTFRITPGSATVMEVEATIFARTELANVGIAPLTSMFMFDATNRNRFDDFRNAVYDSDFMTCWRGNGEWSARSLSNPRTLQISAFADENPRGFGLQQRADEYDDFLDLEARYEKRPSLWIEPQGDWGAGQATLVEIPTDGEFNDNVVAYWRPAQPIPQGESRTFAYFLKWGPPESDRRLFRVVEARSGLSLDQRRRVFVIEFERPDRGPPIASEGDLKADVSATNGAVQNVVIADNVVTGGYRASFELGVDGVELSELRLVLRRGDTQISETWLYRWTR